MTEVTEIQQPNDRQCNSTGDIAAGLVEAKKAESKQESSSSNSPETQRSVVIPITLSHEGSQVRFFNLFTLSMANRTDLYLLRVIYPQVHCYYPVDACSNNAESLQQLNDQVQFIQKSLQSILNNEAQGDSLKIESSRNLIRQALLNYYALAYKAVGVLAANTPDLYSHLPKDIALAIFERYYQNLEMKEEDVAVIMRRLVPQKDQNKLLNDAAFLWRIASILVDQDKYPLQILLPNENFLQVAAQRALRHGILEDAKKFLSKVFSYAGKAIVFMATAIKQAGTALANTALAQKIVSGIFPETIRPFFRDLRDSLDREDNNYDDGQPARDSLQAYKDKVIAILGKYISWWKFSWFGHHHDNRARAVRRQIRSSANIEEIQKILQRQQQIASVSHNPAQDSLTATEWSNSRWNEPTGRKNSPKANHPSGYLAVIEEALGAPRP